MGRDTIEFRIFRGTIDYPRFKAILQFVTACNAFLTAIHLNRILRTNDNCKLVTLAGMERLTEVLGWETFKIFLGKNKQFSILEKYLQNKNI